MSNDFTIRLASIDDLEAIRTIYNEGIEDRIATLETEPKSSQDMVRWWTERDRRYMVLVASTSIDVLGWASLNPFSPRRGHWSVADLSISRPAREGHRLRIARPSDARGGTG
jgi:phosphinothricin acetyltransferase